MNGRMYDPVLARFLSPDPYVQAPDFTQSLNRYAYCWNNPFKYKDPSGNVILEAMLIGGLINLGVQILSGNVANLGDAFKAFGIGALAGLAGGAAGAAMSGVLVGSLEGFAGGALIGAAGGAAGGFVGGAGNALMNGASLNNGLTAGINGAVMGALAGGLIGGLVSGISAAKDGFSFWDGSKTSELTSKQLGINIQTQSSKNSSVKAADKHLKANINKRYNIEEGDYNIKKITTATPSGYRLSSGESFIQGSNSNEFIYGVVREFKSGFSNVYICPGAAGMYNSNPNLFDAVVGHELIHAYHHFFFQGSFVSNYSEAAAYRYSSQKLTLGGFSDSNTNFGKAVECLILSNDFTPINPYQNQAFLDYFINTPF